jgi:hypothetical protein
MNIVINTWIDILLRENNLKIIISLVFHIYTPSQGLTFAFPSSVFWFRSQRRVHPKSGNVLFIIVISKDRGVNPRNGLK